MANWGALTALEQWKGLGYLGLHPRLSYYGPSARRAERRARKERLEERDTGLESPVNPQGRTSASQEKSALRPFRKESLRYAYSSRRLLRGLGFICVHLWPKISGTRLIMKFRGLTNGFQQPRLVARFSFCLPFIILFRFLNF